MAWVSMFGQNSVMNWRKLVTMTQSDPLRDIFTCMSLEIANNEDWKYDTNTTTLLLAQKNLCLLLDSVIGVSNRFENIDRIDVIGFVTSIVNITEWLQDSIVLVRKDGDIDPHPYLGGNNG